MLTPFVFNCTAKFEPGYKPGTNVGTLTPVPWRPLAEVSSRLFSNKYSPVNTADDVPHQSATTVIIATKQHRFKFIVLLVVRLKCDPRRPASRSGMRRTPAHDE